MLLDEPTEGIQPSIIDEISDTLKQLTKTSDITIVLVEQNLQFATSIADRHYVMEQGVVVDQIANDALGASMESLNTYLGG